MTQTPKWISDVSDQATNLILSIVYTYTTADIDHEAAAAVIASATPEAGRRFVPAKLQRIAELVTFAEMFDAEPATAVEVWNTTEGTSYTAAEASGLRDQHRADAIVEAWTLRQPRQPRQLRVVS